MKINSSYWRLLVLALSLILNAPQLLADEPEISWSNGYPKAENVNVGSEKPAYFYLRFDVTKAPIPGAKIVVQFPNYDADKYNPNFPATIAETGNFVDYTGKIAWDNTHKTLTFSGIDLGIGNYVNYKIPHKATDALAKNITSGNYTITVYKNDGTILSSVSGKYLYRRAALSIVPASGLNNLSEDFAFNTWSYQGNAFTEQKYEFGLRVNGGAIDSARVKITIPTQAAIINSSSWKANNTAINRIDSSASGLNTTYMLYLERKHSKDTDGFDDGEVIDISFDLKKRYCSNTPFNITAAWGSSSDYMTAVSQTGSFAANSAITSAPELKRVSVTLQNSGGKLHMDGITPNVFHTRIKNTSQVTAYDINYHLVTPNSPFAAFLDDTYAVGYSMDNGATWTTVHPDYSVPKRSFGVFLINPAYQGKKLAMNISFDSLPGGKELIIKWASCMAPDAFFNDPGMERNWYRPVRHDESWTYTNLCRDIDLQLSNQVIYNVNDIVLGKNLGPIIKLSNGKTQRAELLNLTFGGYAGVMGHAGALYRIRIVLPKGVKIVETAGKPVVTLGAANYNAFTKTAVSNSDSVAYTFDFKQQSADLKKLAVTFETDCTGTDGLQTADISIDYLPTGINNGATPNILMPRIAQFYIPISVVCNTTGITYDFKMYRTTVGLLDTNNDRIPDNATARINSSYSKYGEVDFRQVVTGDTLVFEFDGTVKGEGYNHLYAILFAPVNPSIFKILDYEISGDSIYTVGMTNGSELPVSTGLISPKNLAYYWKITKAGKFKLNERIKLTVKCQAVDNVSSYDPLTYKFSSWFYASESNITTINNAGGILKPESRIGNEEYSQTCTYYKGYFTGWSTSRSSISFTGKQWAEGYAFHNPFYNNMVDFSPFEYRHLVTVDSIVVEVPDGYLIDDNLRFTMTGFGRDNVSFIAKANPVTKTKRKKVFNIREMYASNYGTGNGATTLGMQDGPVSMTMYPMIKSTPRSPEGISTCTLKSATDNHTYTHALIPNASSGATAKQFSSFLLVSANGPGIHISTPEAVNKNLSETRMSWRLKVENTLEKEAKQIWLYVAGPISNVKYNGVSGQGEGNRWVLVPSVPALGYVTSDLTFDVNPGTGCNNQRVVVYPVFNSDNTGTPWTPFGAFTDAAFDFNSNTFDEYVYHELELAMVPVIPQISGGFTHWKNALANPADLSSALSGNDSIEVGKPFTVEVVFDASASAAPIAHLEAQVSFPKGLKYVPNSAYIEYQQVNTQIKDADWINLLETLNDANSGIADTITFKLKDIIDQPTIASMFGSEASISGGKKATFRLQLQPTCDIDIHAEQLTAKFSGKRYCDLITTASESNMQAHLSSKLALKNALIPFNSELGLVLDVDSLTMQGVKELIEVTFRLKKQTKLGENMSPTDSVRVAIPASMNLVGNITYDFPAYSGHGLDIPGESGVLPVSANYEADQLRNLSWTLPQAYFVPFASKAISNEVTLTYRFTLETKQSKIDLQDTSEITIFTISERAPHATCPIIITEVDSVADRVSSIPIYWSSIDEISGSDRIRMYPNPVSVYDEQLTIESESAIKGIMVMDLSGRIVVSKQFSTDFSTFRHQLNVKNWSKGTYLVRVNTNDEISTRKIIAGAN